MFSGELGVLERAYIAVDEAEAHCDHDGSTFARILDQDPDFLFEYVNFRYERSQHPTRHDDTRDYTFLWNRDDYVDVITKLVDRVYELESKHQTFFHSYLQAFFRVTDSKKSQESIVKRQDHVLTMLIKRSHDNSEFIRFIFALIAEIPTCRRTALIATFLECNKKYDAFKGLRLEPLSWSWSGSAVPMYQGRVEFLESILPLLDGVDFLKHRQLVEQHIQGLRSQIEREKKEDFMEN